MFKKFCYTILCTVSIVASSAQTKPKLVVGIVVDQMRYDYLLKFSNRYTAGGFNRVVKDGFSCVNTHYNYVPTYTGPGHASIFTGATPAIHGVIANYWFDKKTNTKETYCVADSTVSSVGSGTTAGQMSSKRMLSSTVGDQLRLSNNFKSKVFGIALKDRAAILPAGHSANGAFWFDGETGKWVSSSQYMEKLPGWLSKYNDSKEVDSYLSKIWVTHHPIQSYVSSIEDNNPYEEPFIKGEKPEFPYVIQRIFDEIGYDVLKATPYGNDMTTELAIKIIENESLGKDEFPDLLAISYSATDYVGHQFGPHSIELEDTYLRLDESLSGPFSFLDKQVGAANYVIFLTADHGAVEVPAFLKSKNIPGGYFKGDSLKEILKIHLENVYQDSSILLNVSNNQVFLDYAIIKSKKLDSRQIVDELSKMILEYEGVANVYDRFELSSGTSNQMNFKLIQMGFNQKLSGDIAFSLLPGWISYGETGTTHGSGYSYDTHVPLVWYGSGIKKGQTNERFHITDIAPTIATILNIEQPNGSIGNPIEVK